MVTILLATGCTKRPVLSYEDGVKAGCFDAGGKIGPEGLDPRCPYTVHFGGAGEFFSYWDPGLKTCVIDMAEEHRTSPGLPLWEIKAKGLTYEFEMPFNGQINHSAEFIWIDDTLCIPGNPVYCNGKSVFPQGMQVKVSTDAGNNSAGIFLIQQTP